MARHRPPRPRPPARAGPGGGRARGDLDRQRRRPAGARIPALGLPRGTYRFPRPTASLPHGIFRRGPRPGWRCRRLPAMTGAGRLTLFAEGIAFSAAAIVRWRSGYDPDLAGLMATPRDDEPLTEEERAVSRPPGPRCGPVTSSPSRTPSRTRRSPEPIPEGSRPGSRTGAGRDPAEEQLRRRRSVCSRGNVPRLEGNPRRYRLRVEGIPWRVTFEVDQRRKRITVLLVARRAVV